MGGFSQCCYHNVCAQTLLQLSIWIHNEKVPGSRTQTVHTLPFLWTQEAQKNIRQLQPKLDLLLELKNSRERGICHRAIPTQILPSAKPQVA